MENTRESSEERSSTGNLAAVDTNGKILNESDYEAFKIFAGGLNRATTAEGLADHFGKYGQVVHTEIVADKNTGKSRGFGFVTFATEDVVKKVLEHTHKIDNVVVDVKQAVRKEKSKDLIATRDDTNRIFVGGISDSITDERFREYFAKYGPVVSYNYLFDKATNKPRGFGFVIFENAQDSEKALGPHTSLGRNCEAKRAQPRPSATSGASNRNTTPQNLPEGFDYAALYYAQANMMYNPYFAQMYANNQMPQMAYFNQMAAQGQMYPFVGNWNGEEQAGNGANGEAPPETTNTGTSSNTSKKQKDSDDRPRKRSPHGNSKGRKSSRAEPY
ncbi:bifunctional Nucleotide-binding alpha-beta plait domain superfamily/RNA recognition motif domain/RNA-binding domain superfamily [Babesia duncani]|uniref:Bifunctional Nucleotide-binding alpha-beta plait domain superfamily/RNA recognition motif domain/RNA-binding domain superfamily n=1 Tax=Babesia duncani TaxID=323732 RepID=A0AAD9PI79_9APIC|nr:bifunctional Nucleotide-binding alpha-beta plait domain superfamily/RNA recognition motif domain/RNA-binding domain superfamily [Babesia duncani]KAK2196803.1 bifunctional Nucleotide-binding alpha-beta plait domain superfamily/RNA recognition motif domain/RNA-binding domain superfamily [Babesia duncani]